MGFALPAAAASGRTRLRHAATSARGRGRALRCALLRQAVRGRDRDRSVTPKVTYKYDVFFIR